MRDKQRERETERERERDGDRDRDRDRERVSDSFPFFKTTTKILVIAMTCLGSTGSVHVPNIQFVGEKKDGGRG